MSAWRREAIKLLPKLRPLIERSRRVERLWLELYLEFLEAYEDPRDEGTIGGVHAYALWCWQEVPALSVRSAAIIGFWEAFPWFGYPAVRADMPNRLSNEQFERLSSQVLGGRLYPDDLAAVSREFAAAKSQEDLYP